MKNNISSVSHSELPLKNDSSNLFLEIMCVISVFLFTITLVGFFMVNSLVANWDKGIVNGFTVQILSDDTVSSEDNDTRVNKVLSFFENLSLVEKVGQMFIIGIDGYVADETVMELIQTYKVGGFIIDEKNLSNGE